MMSITRINRLKFSPLASEIYTKTETVDLLLVREEKAMNIHMNTNLNSIQGASLVVDRSTAEDVNSGTLQIVESMAVNHGFSKVGVNTMGVDAMPEGADFASVIKSQASLVKDNMTNIMNKLSISDVKKMDEEGEGYNEKDVDEVVDVVKRIKIMLATYCDDYIPMGSLDVEDVKGECDSAMLAAKVMKKLSSYDMPVTRDNVRKVSETVREYSELKPLSEAGKRYMISKGLESDIHNMYLSSSIGDSYMGVADAITTKDLENLRPQIAEKLKTAGFEPDPQNMVNAELILKEGKGIDAKNMAILKEIDEYDYSLSEDDVIDLTVRSLARDSKIAPSEDKLMADIQKRRDIIMDSGIEKVLDIVNASKPLTVENLSEATKSPVAEAYDEAKKAQYIESYTYLVYAKSSLSVANLYRLESLGIDTASVSLKDMTDKVFELEKDSAVAVTVKELLSDTPLNTIAELYDKEKTVDTYVKTGLKLKFEMSVALKSYETMGTEIRSDLGDNLKNAVAGSASLLLNMGLEDSSENMAALKIISYSQLELSAANVSAISKDYADVRNIIDNISPKLVYELISEGEDIWGMDIGKLSKRVDEYGRKADKDDYAKFLYKLDKDGIDSAVRQEYIRVYRAFDRMRRDDAKSLGDVIRQGKALTTTNIISAYVSRKDAKLDIYTGETYRSIDYDYLGKLSDSETPSEYYEERYEEVKEALSMDSSVVEELLRYDLPVTVDNLLASYRTHDRAFFEKLERDDEEVSERLSDIVDVMDDEEALNRAYDEALELADSKLRNSVSLELDQIVQNLSFIGKKRGREYQIPLKRGDELVNVNLKVVSGADKGRLSISFSAEGMKLSSDIRVTSNSVQALVVCEDERMASLVRERESAVIDSLVEAGFSNNRVDVTTSSQMIDIMEEYTGSYEEGTLKLYKVAKIFIEEIAKS